ncbi:helix-turn-helix domain protein [Actinobacteria bacterium OK074]|nr:helix-turn-helix domain protein [Actinobacteria bacterium OK074]
MSAPKNLNPGSSPRALLGAELRYAREKANLSQDELGATLFVSGSFIGQLEAGTRRLLPEYAPTLDKELGTGEFFQRNCGAAAKSSYPEHFAEAVEAEARASAIREYASMLIPGLLQTPAYARAVSRAYQPTAAEEAIEDVVSRRMERTRILNGPTKPLLWAVLDEAALRRVTGSRAVMAEALEHIAEMIRSNQAIVQVLPYDAGAHPAMQGCIKLMDFSNEPPMVYLEGVYTGRLDDDPATVARYKLLYEFLQAAALDPQKSLALIEKLAQDYAHEEQP